MANKRVTLDLTKLSEELYKKKISKTEFERMIGRGETYLSHHNADGNRFVSDREEALICRTLGKPEGYFIYHKEVKKPEQTYEYEITHIPTNEEVRKAIVAIEKYARVIANAFSKED